MNFAKRFGLAVFAVASVAAASTAQARADVQWGVSIGGPIGVEIYSQPPRYYAPPVFFVPVPYPGRPVYAAPGYGSGRGWDDRDGDGIPNRYDRAYTPRWDRDGDGIPNRYDRYDNRRDWHGDRRGGWQGRDGWQGSDGGRGYDRGHDGRQGHSGR